MGRDAKLRAARRVEKANTKETMTRLVQKSKLETATRFLAFLEAAKTQTTPGMTFFDPKSNQLHFLPLTEISDPEILAMLDGTDFLLHRVVSVQVAEGWNTKSITLAELDRQIEEVQAAIIEAEAELHPMLEIQAPA